MQWSTGKDDHNPCEGGRVLVRDRNVVRVVEQLQPRSLGISILTNSTEQNFSKDPQGSA